MWLITGIFITVYAYNKMEKREWHYKVVEQKFLIIISPQKIYFDNNSWTRVQWKLRVQRRSSSTLLEQNNPAQNALKEDKKELFHITNTSLR